MRNHLAVGVLMGVVAPFGLFAASPAVAADDAQVSVFHGIPDTTVDVFVNNDLTLDNFKPGDIAGPLDLPADTYSVKITDSKDDKTVLLGPIDVTVAAGGNYTIAAFLDAKGDPTAKAFQNDVSMIAAGQARVTVRHTAAAPAVNIEANGDVLVKDLTNGKEAVAEVPADKYDVAIVPASGGKAVWSQNVDLGEGMNTIAYAWGSLADGNFAVAVQTIDGMHSAPTDVAAGEVGLADDSPSTSPWLLVGLAASLIVGVFASVRLVRSRA